MSLLALVQAQRAFYAGDIDRDGAQDYATLEELYDAGLIDRDLAAGVKDGYVIQCAPALLDRGRWLAVANPASGVAWSRSFCVDQTGLVRESPWPIPFDPVTGAIPPGTVRLGR